MKDFLKKLWKDEEGAETVEWVLVAAGLAVVAAAVYAGSLQDGLTAAMESLTGYVQTTVDGIGGGTP